MRVKFTYHPYRRPFRQPLSTSHGQWREREGIVIQLMDEEDQEGWGEIAPVPWFGSEALEQALEFCAQLPSLLDVKQIAAIPDRLPACQFGFEVAWEELAARRSGELAIAPTSEITNSVLLPTGKAALTGWQRFWQQGDRTFKWKIGIASLEEELALFQRLMADFPSDARLRLDANGGLNLEKARRWLEMCESFPVEYLEQPLPPDQLDDLLKLSTQSSTPLALDESVATLEQLKYCYDQGWRGVYVIKPAIAGFPSQLREFCQTHAIDAVFSSVFETRIGRQAGLTLATELGNGDRAMGYGVNHWFDEPEEWGIGRMKSSGWTGLSLTRF